MHILISVCCINERRIRILSTRWEELKLSSVDNMWSFKVSLHSIHITDIQPPKTYCKITHSTVYTISSQTSSCLHNILTDLIMFTQYPHRPHPVYTISTHPNLTRRFVVHKDQPTRSCPAVKGDGDTDTTHTGASGKQIFTSRYPIMAQSSANRCLMVIKLLTIITIKLHQLM